ncbi:MAG: tRNA-dihydrouridine synthase [Lachnospiraceae bacterium]|nr:tRNA-dihydrouridine synthase [Lachnospiraceae bacterium]
MCRYILQGRTDAGYFRDMTRAIKGACKIPVVLSGGVHTAEEAEALLQEGDADLIGAARVLLQNPKWPEQEEALAERST